MIFIVHTLDTSEPSTVQNTSEPATPTTTVEPTTSANTAAAGAVTHLNIWDKFPIKLLKACQESKIPLPSDRRMMVNLIVDYLINDIKDTRRKMTEIIAKNIVEKYPNSFRNTIHGDTIGAGYESLQVQIYNAMMYQKEIAGKKHRAPEDDGSDEENVECAVSRKHDEYGCTEYQPLLTSFETKESQEEKRLKLCQLYESQQQEKQQCLDLMEETYPSQILAINSKRKLDQVLAEWPLLGDSTFLVAHSSRLLGKPINEEWNNSLLGKGKMIAN